MTALAPAESWRNRITSAGEEAPDFELPTLQGDRVRLSSFRRSNHVLLEFGSIT